MSNFYNAVREAKPHLNSQLRAYLSLVILLSEVVVVALRLEEAKVQTRHTTTKGMLKLQEMRY